MKPCFVVTRNLVMIRKRYTQGSRLSRPFFFGPSLPELPRWMINRSDRQMLTPRLCYHRHNHLKAHRHSSRRSSPRRSRCGSQTGSRRPRRTFRTGPRLLSRGPRRGPSCLVQCRLERRIGHRRDPYLAGLDSKKLSGWRRLFGPCHGL